MLCYPLQLRMSAIEIDEDAQSRQLAVYGREALLTLGTAKILISGLNGLGVEIGAPSKQAKPAAACAVAVRSGRLFADPMLAAVHILRTAKNVSLAGVSAITLHDTVATTAMDLGAQVRAARARARQTLMARCAAPRDLCLLTGRACLRLSSILARLTSARIAPKPRRRG